MKLQLAATILAATFLVPAQAQTETSGGTRWWAVNNEWVNDLAKDFNASQKDYRVVPLQRQLRRSMTAAWRPFAPATPPHILQVFEVGTPP